MTWTADTIVPHTVTFLPPSGPPAGVVPFVTVVPVTPFDGSQFLNGSFGGVPLFNATSKFSYTFTKPGTYSYVCLLHADQGMAGVIVVGAPGSGVAPSTGTISPPNTGDAGLLGTNSNAWMMYTGVAMIVASMAGAYVFVRR